MCPHESEYTTLPCWWRRWVIIYAEIAYLAPEQYLPTILELVHSDRGSSLALAEFQAPALKHSAQRSMTRSGCNANFNCSQALWPLLVSLIFCRRIEQISRWNDTKVKRDKKQLLIQQKEWLAIHTSASSSTWLGSETNTIHRKFFPNMPRALMIGIEQLRES